MQKNGIKKRLAILLCVVSLCLSCMPSVYAASGNAKPALEIMATSFTKNSVGGVSPTIWYRNNSSKTIKYIDWYMVAYNAVNDPVACEIRRQKTRIGETTGPIEPFTASSGSYLTGTIWTGGGRSKDDPMREYRCTNYYINNGGTHNYGSVSMVFEDKNGDFFVSDSYYSLQNPTYLTQDEINNALFSDRSTWECLWYNSTIKSFTVTKAIVQYMDGSKQTISGSKLYSSDTGAPLQNEPIDTLTERYSAVYNYSDYLKYNPALAESIGKNPQKLLEHFITCGMQEGRQASDEFNVKAYKENNPDLVKYYGDDNIKYYEHYISCGKAEGRKAT